MESTATTGEITGCMDGVCATATLTDAAVEPARFDVYGKTVSLRVGRNTNGVFARFAFGQPATDGSVFRVTLREPSGATKSVKTDPVAWTVAYPNGSACPACFAPKNLAIHPD